MACHDTQSTGRAPGLAEAQVLSVQDESHQCNGWNLVAGALLDGASIVPAIVAVLVFRLITYWLILVPGVLRIPAPHPAAGSGGTGGSVTSAGHPRRGLALHA
jgi:hypothetical protein